MDNNRTPAQKKFAEWEAYVRAHSGEPWDIGKAYDAERGWCPIWRVGDKALSFTVGDGRIYLKTAREGLDRKLDELDDEARAKIHPADVREWFDAFDQCVQQCMRLNEQGAVPKALGGSYEEPLSEYTDSARLMASLRPDGSEGDPEALDRAPIEALAKEAQKDQILEIASAVYGFALRLQDGGVDPTALPAGMHLGLLLLVIGGVLDEGATDDEVLAFMAKASEASLSAARGILAANAIGETEKEHFDA